MKRLARVYWKIVEKDTGYLIGIVPYTRKSDQEMKEDLSKVLKLFYDLHPSYKGVDVKISQIKRILQNDDTN